MFSLAWIIRLHLLSKYGYHNYRKKIDGEGDNPPYGCEWHLQECVINCDCENVLILIINGKKKLTNQ